MTEVILNDECMHCVHKECHDGYHFCNQAMKDNSFYKNKKLYKGLEVIQRPTYEELEKENAELKERLKEHESVGNSQFWENVWSWKTKAEQLTKAKEIIKKFSEFVNNEIEYDPEHPQEHTDLWNKLCEEAEQFLKDSKQEG